MPEIIARSIENGLENNSCATEPLHEHVNVHVPVPLKLHVPRTVHQILLFCKHGWFTQGYILITCNYILTVPWFVATRPYIILTYFSDVSEGGAL